MRLASAISGESALSSQWSVAIRKIANCALFFALGIACAKYCFLGDRFTALEANADAYSTAFHRSPEFSVSKYGSSIAAALGAVLVAGVCFGILKVRSREGTSSKQGLKSVWLSAQRSSRGAARQKDVENVSRGLETQITQIVEILRKFLKETSAQSLAYEEVRVSLETAQTVEQVQAAVQALLTNSLQAKRDAEELKVHLNKAQTETALMREKLGRVEKLAALDGLTSLANRRSFEEFLREAVADSHAEHTPLSLVMADLDHFKRINDKYGHQTGDAVIKKFAGVLSESVRRTDFVARYGGEEFAVVLPRTPMGNASFVVERIRNLIKTTDWVDPTNGLPIERVTASFGIAEIKDGEKPEKIIERADRKLYSAKRNGRNRVEIDCTSGLDL